MHMLDIAPASAKARQQAKEDQEKTLTLTVPLSPSILTNHPFVHAKSDGEWPAPTGCTLAPSLLANSRICRHWRAVVGTKTRCGLHLNVLAQLEKVASGELEETEMGWRAA